MSYRIVLARNGKTWFMLQNPNIEPYSHTVSYEDGATHTYTTLERPNCHFNEKGEGDGISRYGKS